MDYEPIRTAFARRFPTGTFSSLDFRPTFDGHGHTAWLEIMPAESIAAARL